MNTESSIPTINKSGLVYLSIGGSILLSAIASVSHPLRPEQRPREAGLPAGRGLGQKNPYPLCLATVVSGRDRELYQPSDEGLRRRAIGVQ